MKMLKRLIIVLLLTIPVYTFAQTGISGGVFDYENKSFPLQKVTVKNLNNQKVVVTGAAGQFTITANKGDLLEFSLPGYHTDTLYLTNLQAKTIYLPSQSTNLKQVEVRGAKLSNDLQLKDPNAPGFNRVSGIPPTTNTSRAGGVGLAFGSGKDKRERAKVKRLEETSAYETEINQYFNEEHVGELIKLQGQELKDFINLYRPSVARVKSDHPFNYDFYIAQAYQTWLKLPPEGRRLPPVPTTKKN
ncbi:CarboxypepD_reg-like domain-containing protein [Pedobacter hartonius]|uniref:CarboxypepD_reg-like domain-containing protein n=2 Tax=Pedobacter hartonius TaxID=425514 RepID=A0A1H3YTE2_9SPHI|nr:CarboxypepD_reg-like domain-containing protein [Pedobacter hartonius]